METKILNTWQSAKEDKKFFTVGKPIFSIGDYKIYKQSEKCYLHTFKNIALNQLCAPNKEHLQNLLDDNRPLINTKYTPKTFVFDRAKETLQKGLEILNQK